MSGLSEASDRETVLLFLKCGSSVNYLINCKTSVIMEVEGSGAIRQAEVNVTREMIDRVEATYDIKPKRLAADTAYGSAPMLNWLVEEKDIEPRIPVFDKSARKDGSFERGDFIYDEVYLPRKQRPQTLSCGGPQGQSRRECPQGWNLSH